MWDVVYPYLAALLPTVGILVLFYLVIRNVMAADRQERKAQAQWRGTNTPPGERPRSGNGVQDASGRHSRGGGSSASRHPSSADGDEGQGTRR